TSDLVCRYGGEEFTVLLPDTDLQQAINLAERICRELPAALSRHGARWSKRRGTAAIGLACFPSEASTLEGLTLLADRRLYAGKARGRACVVPGADEATPAFPEGAQPAVAT